MLELEKIEPSTSEFGHVRERPYFLSSFLSKMSSVPVDYKDVVLRELNTMYVGEMAAGQKFKALAYKKAMDNIRRMPGPLRAVEDLAGIEGIGKAIHDKVAEVISTGALRAAERMKTHTDVSAMDALLGVHGIGPVKARELIAAGITSIDALRAAVAANPKTLNDTQKLGLKHYEDGLERIPRAEMVTHEATLLAGLPAGLNGTIVGSYRRGAVSSGDIDMLVSYPTGVTDTYAQDLFKVLVERLTTSGYVVDKLVSGSKKWMGYVRIGSGKARRLDLLLTPPEEYAYAILYFTGSDKFNIAFRRWCLERGYTLNEHTMKPTGAAAAAKPAPPPMATEEDIFAFVGLKYVKPNERVDGAQIIAA